MVKRVEKPGASEATGVVVDEASTFGIRLFGQPPFTVSGKPHRFSALPRTLPVLAYLLLQRGAHLTCENVAFALWPDDSEDESTSQPALTPASPQGGIATHRVLRATGDEVQAKVMFKRTRAAFEELRDAIPDAETREGFSALPHRRHILSLASLPTTPRFWTAVASNEA